MIPAHWFTPLSVQEAGTCFEDGCSRQSHWAIDHSLVTLCDTCLYHWLERLNNDREVSTAELAPSFFDYVRGMLPRHMASCGWCLSLCSVRATVECLLDNEFLAPFIDHRSITPAHLEQLIHEYWEASSAHSQA